MKSINAYLSRKAQAVEPGALVYCEDREEDGGRWEEWTLELAGEVVGLGENFGEAKAGVLAWVKSRRAREA
jgi:hypothetical protein